MTARHVSRRTALLATLGIAIAGCTNSGTSATPGSIPHTPVDISRIDYGTQKPQFGDLYLPRGSASSLRTVVLIHGGGWRADSTLDSFATHARDLVDHGFAVWNLEYRAVGSAGGWPATFDDIATGVDALLGPVQQAAAGRLDLHQVTAIGHSAGGHLAVWLAGRPRLPSGAPGAGPAVPVGAVIALAPVVDLEQAVVSGGDRNVVNLMGGTPAEQPTRYALGSPIRRLPVGIPVFCIHGDADTTVPVSQSQRYVAAAKVAGDPARLLELSGVTHSGVVDLSGEGWRVARTSLLNGA